MMRRTLTIAAVLLIGGLGAVVMRARPSEPVLPYYDSPELTPRWHDVSHRVAPFTMTTQTGEVLKSDDLAGRIYVASFIYTRCSVVCPGLIRSLRQVEAAISDARLTLLSFSVTPDQDSPAVLAEFGRDRRIDPQRWKLLTGAQGDIYRLAHSSFFADDERLTGTGNENEFLHTEKLVLVDGVGKVRGVYNGSQRFDVEHLIDDARKLLR
jgi:protein SCO1